MCVPSFALVFEKRYFFTIRPSKIIQNWLIFTSPNTLVCQGAAPRGAMRYVVCTSPAAVLVSQHRLCYLVKMVCPCLTFKHIFIDKYLFTTGRNLFRDHTFFSWQQQQYAKRLTLLWKKTLSSNFCQISKNHQGKRRNERRKRKTRTQGPNRDDPQVLSISYTLKFYDPSFRIFPLKKINEIVTADYEAKNKGFRRLVHKFLTLKIPAFRAFSLWRIQFYRNLTFSFEMSTLSMWLKHIRRFCWKMGSETISCRLLNKLIIGHNKLSADFGDNHK